MILHVRELHSHIKPVMKAFSEFLVARPSRYIAVSDAVQHALVRECGIEQRRIQVINVFIPERHFETIRAESTRRNDRALVIGGSGRPGWRKGTTLWLQMAAEARRLLGPSVGFVWVGMTEWPDPHWLEGLKFQREAHLLGLENCIDFIPSNSRPLEYFANFDVFAMTSWEDPCPRVVLENMGLGKPVICFAGGGGAPEVVGDTGVIYRSSTLVPWQRR